MNKTNETIYRKRITRPIRIAFMLSLIMMFFVVSPIVVLYAMGYRYDTGTKLITQSGVITVETEQKDVQILLNNEEVASDVPFEMRNVYPGNYLVEIKKDEYIPWKKQVSIREKETTYVNDLNLVRIDDALTPLTKNIQENSILTTSPNKKFTVIISEKGNSVYELAILTFENENINTIMRSYSDRQPQVIWSENGNNFVVRTRTKNAESIKRYTLSNYGIDVQTTIYPRDAITQVFWYNENVYVASSSGNTIIGKDTKTPLYTSSTFWIPNGNKIYQKQGSRLISDTNAIILSGAVGTIEIVTNDFALIRSYDGFSLISFTQGHVKKIPTSEIIFDKERQVWITWSEYEIWEISEQGDIYFINRFGSPIIDIEPLDEFGMLAISFPTEIIVYYPKFNLQIQILSSSGNIITTNQVKKLLYLQFANSTEIRTYKY